jgi:glutamyl-Q tRNA(Asp) synthetase
VLTDAGPIRFTDAIQGPCTQSLAETGDFILLRRDGYFAYQLAVVIDDAHQGITEVVRGSDLLDSTARQIHLQRLLGFATPGYVHLPVAVNAAGDKLSKQTRARALDPARPLPDLIAALAFLGQQPPAELADGTPGEVVDWAVRHWRLDRVPRRLTLPSAAHPRTAGSRQP